MIHLTSLNFTPKEIVQNVFSPLVGSVCSSLAEDICQKNNLSFVELIQPFCRLSSDAHFRDVVSGTSVSIKGLRLNICDVSWKPPQTILARKMLNEAVSSAQCDKTTFLRIDENIVIETPTSELWFEQWRETFLTVQFPSDHEFTRHFLCCLIVVSSSDQNPLEVSSQLTKKVQMMQNITPPKLPKWFSTDTLNCYVMLHDARTGDITKAQQGFESLKMTYGEHRCFLIQINSCTESSGENVDHWIRYIKRHQRTEPQSDQDSAPKTPQDMSGVTSMPTSVQMSSLETPPSEVVVNEVMVHPLSPVQEVATDSLTSAMSTSTDSLITTPMNPNVWGNEEIDAPHGMWLSPNDIENLKHFVQDFTIRALIPYVEKLVGLLNDSIANKKGVSRSLLSATKRWFVTNKPGVAGTQNAVVYTAESTELQTRKLGDLYFMFGNYSLAFQSYHQAKRDFNADSAWQYYAGALEMAALSAFMQGTSNKKTYDYMEEAIVTYLSICKLPQFATRATMLSIECLKVAKLFGDAAKQLIRMTSEDSDLRSALLLEQASYCFLYSQPALFRKYSFHSVLAGFRYSKCGQRKHAFRCYKQAYNVFENRGWSLAEDHIQYTIGKQAVTLKKLDEASAALAHLLRPSSLQSASQQAAFLREYIATQKAFLQQNDISDILNIALPSIVQNMTKVLVTSLPPVSNPYLIPATNININSNLDEEWKWNKLEEMVVQLALKKPLMIFKPTRSLFTSEIPSTENPFCIHGEPIEISLTLENTIKPSIAFDDINLLWIFTNENGEMISNKILFKPDITQHEIEIIQNVIASTSINSIQLNEHEKKSVSIRLTPRFTGKLQIFGVVGNISAVNDPSSLLGQISFERIEFKSKTKDTSASLEKPLDYDKKLEIIVLPPAPALHVNFSPTPFDVLAGEIIPVTINLTNAGADVLSDIYVGTENPRLVLINPDEAELPLSVLKDFRDLTNEAFSKDKEARKQHVFKLFQGECIINPKETKSTTIWLQAPYYKGATEIKILIYYSMPVGYPKLKYRLIRHTWNFNVLESISVEGNCNIGNVITNELGIDLNIKNLNQVHHPLATEIMLNDITLYSPDYQVNSNKKVIYMNSPGYNRIFIENSGLKTSECLNLRFALTETSNSQSLIPLDFNNKRFSNFHIQKINDMEKFVPTFKKLGSFLMKTETKFVKIFGQIGNSEEFNNIISIPDRHMTISITWKGIINDNSSVRRVSYGQHFIQLRNIYESVYSPSIDRIQQTSFASHEHLFGIFDFKYSIPNNTDQDQDGWAVNNVSVARRCFLEDDSQNDIQDIGQQTIGKVY